MLCRYNTFKKPSINLHRAIRFCLTYFSFYFEGAINRVVVQKLQRFNVSKGRGSRTFIIKLIYKECSEIKLAYVHKLELLAKYTTVEQVTFPI